MTGLRKRVAGWIIAALARLLHLVPPSSRFGVAVRLASLWSAVAARGVLRVQEAALYRILERAARNGVRFPLPLIVPEAAALTAACTSGSGVLLVATHAPLNRVLVGYMEDAGLSPTIVASRPSFPILGTSRVLDTLQPSYATWLRVRRQLARGGLVCTMIDAKHVPERRAIELPTAAGSVRISAAPLRLAARCGATVVCSQVQLSGEGQLVATLTIVPAADLESVTESFAGLLQEDARRSA